jgi:N-dimethylarginine dimethylaminohydrolase
MTNKTINKVLLCRPTYFASLQYVINPWMRPGTINQKKAMKQWENLVAIYHSLGIQTEIINSVPNQPDMVFATDQGLIFGKKVLLSRFRFKERQGETPLYKQWFETHGYEIIELPEHLYFEGNGTIYLWNDKLFVGFGYRTDLTMCRYLQKMFPYEVIPLRATAPAFYHLDIGFLPLNNETIFYYPEAYTKESRGVLKKLVPHLITLSEKEMEGFCANSIVTGKTVIHQSGNPTFIKKLTDLGYNSIEVDLSEFKKSGGGAHCLTNILD